ncbi:GNAT family N-acetyltransferase [Paenibacillus sp. N4]|uniref:GNAT family N-acetyltransferase n=1 Tax=Paenibacillus vietnamensis TaxID=2590547 RepID=UPI001CD07A55|nr:GNAT family N-acetyltransferase [Paenibacillus vietnamensis]MCA0758233.1 GNAT family N-acetyltransferase [Paenibacillus vietnamensis]
MKPLNVEIKPVTLEHFNESMALSQFAFQYERTEQELEQTKDQLQDEPADRWGSFINGQMAAQATVLELQTYINGRPFAMGGLAGVATWPEYRRQGLVAKLLVHSLQTMKEKGLTISFLHPFAFGFYRRFGWETYTEHKSYTIKADQLPLRTAVAGRVARHSGSYDLLYPIYEGYASKYNGSLMRTEQWWKYRIAKRKPGQIAVYYNEQEQPEGYLIYEVKEMKLRVHELVSLSQEASSGLWSFIAQHDSMIGELTVTVPSDDLLPFTLSNPRIKQEIIPYFMARIVDAEAFVRQYPFEASDREDQLLVELTDIHAEWNEGCFLLRISPEGKAEMVRIKEKINHSMTITTDIGTFTCMLLGYQKPARLAQLTRITGESEAIKRLQARIPERTTYLPDFF